MNKNKVSIIMATFNCEDTINEAVDSIINQSYQNWELIVCDDCSTDKTLLILKLYKKKLQNKMVLLKNKKKSKLAYSLNQCLKYAKGEYVARMDGDDISLKDRLEKQINFIVLNPLYDVVGTAMLPFDKKEIRKPYYAKKIPSKFDLVMNPCFHHGTILMKKSVYDALNGYTVLPRTSRGQDWDLWFRFFAAGYKGYNLDEPLYKYREDITDLKRRTFTTRLQAVQTAFYGFRLLHYPTVYYFYIAKQIIAGIVPRTILHNYHKKKCNELN